MNGLGSVVRTARNLWSGDTVISVEVDMPPDLTVEQAVADFQVADATLDEAERVWQEARAIYEPIVEAKRSAELKRAQAALRLLTVLDVRPHTSGGH